MIRKTINLFIIGTLLTSYIIAQDSTIIILSHGDKLSVEITDVQPYGLIIGNEETVSFRVIDTIKSTDYELIQKINFTLANSDSAIERNMYVLSNLQKTKESSEKLPFKPLLYNSTSFYLAVSQKFRYHFDLDYTLSDPPILASLGLSVGREDSQSSIDVYGYSLGFGHSYFYHNYRVNWVIEGLRVFDPSEPRVGEDKSRGVSLIGLDSNVQFILGPKRRYLLSLGLRHTIFGTDEYKDGSNLNFYLGIGINHRSTSL